MDFEQLNTKQKGNRGEDLAVDYLIHKGYVIICRQYRSRKGEIDIVAQDTDQSIVFLEVKSSNSGSCGNPLFWITPAKQRTIALIALQYLTEHKLCGTPCRFDVIAINKGKIDHLRNAFLIK